MTDDRVSVTQKPQTIVNLEELIEDTHNTKSDLYNIGLDVLHWVWSILQRGGDIGYRLPGEEWTPVVMFIPGMRKKRVDVTPITYGGSITDA